jgi:hypothetical protein
MRNFLLLTTMIVAAAPAAAGEITLAGDGKIVPAFDIVSAEVSISGAELIFEMFVSGEAGAEKPTAKGKFPGAGVYAYVWPTSLDSSAAGFSAGEGILALAVTAHPDFDDTPAHDEDGDGKSDNDGAGWHSHWVVLTKDEACGAGLKVKDVAPGQDVTMPPSAPGVPLFLDSPGHVPNLAGSALTIKVPLPAGTAGASFDGVTSGLKINAESKAPLLCVTDVFKIASGDLSLPGRIEEK